MGAAILVRGLGNWATAELFFRDVLLTVRLLSCHSTCETLAVAILLLGPLLQTVDWTQNMSQSKQRAITKIERTPPQEGGRREGKSLSQLLFLSADPHSEAE